MYHAEDHHMQTLFIDNYESAGERSWYAWIRRAEKLCGHDLDGNSIESHSDYCGYSIDEASESFDANKTPEQYVAMIRARAGYKPQ